MEISTVEPPLLAVRRTAATLGVALLAGAPAHVAAQQDGQAPSGLPVSVVAESMTIDRGANTYGFEELRIEEDGVTLEAGHAVATGPDAERNEWRFSLEDGVRLQIDSSVIHAEQARFTFAAEELLTGELTGTPATFEDTAPSGEGPVRGTANRIVYDKRAGIVRLEGEASFTLGPNRIRDCDLAYDLNQERVDSGSSGAEPCTITIVPPAEEEAAEDADGPR